MLHSNAGELHQLFSTFNRVWGAGGDASLSLKTVDGKVSAVLEVQLGPPSAPCPGAPEASRVAGSRNQQLGQKRRRRHRGPGRQARDAARRDAWRRRKLENQSSLQVPRVRRVLFFGKKKYFFLQKKVTFFLAKKVLFLQKKVTFFVKKSTFFAKKK